MIVDLFAGPGGWDEGLRLLGRRDVVGIDFDPYACATARAAGHDRLEGGVGTTFFPGRTINDAKITGVIASPPCQGFSMAGKGAARKDTDLILSSVSSFLAGGTPDVILDILRRQQSHEGSALVLEPLRWVLDLMPSWTCWEQVPTVLPLWEACAVVLRSRGYKVWTGKVHAEQYGVPQTRTRAVLIAARDWPHGDNPESYLAPVPTHSRYHTHKPSRMDEGVLPWVSMASALRTNGLPWLPRAANEGTTFDDMAWTYERPAPTMVGSFRPDVAAKPAYRKAGDTPRQRAPGSVLLTVAEAGVLQSFPRDYPWQGSTAQQHLQVGNAVPPLLAAAILKQVL